MSFARTTAPIPSPDLDAARSGRISVAAFAQQLARAHEIRPAEAVLDTFADAASRLSDAEVCPDATEDLLVALARAGIISTADSMALQAAHLRQTAG